MYLHEGCVNIRQQIPVFTSKNGPGINSPEPAFFMPIIITRVCCFNTMIVFSEIAFLLYLNPRIKAKLQISYIFDPPLFLLLQYWDSPDNFNIGSLSTDIWHLWIYNLLILHIRPYNIMYSFIMIRVKAGLRLFEHQTDFENIIHTHWWIWSKTM